MDLSILHHPTPNGSPRDYTMKDKLNSWTSLRSCRFLEWTGWYSFAIDQRLLGHYRLFQHFKTSHARRYSDLSAIQAYIFHYRFTNGLKYFLGRVLSVLNFLGDWKDYFIMLQVITVDHVLIGDSSEILQKFLVDSETDFEQALAHALRVIREPSFLDQALKRPINISFSRYNTTNATHQHSHPYEIRNECNYRNIPPAENTKAKGKEKGVFSKHQILILFDLLSQSSKLEKIDFEKKTWFEKIAALLHALTGKSAASWMDELKDHRTRELYEYHTKGEFGQLLGAITNLAEIFENANFHWIAEMAYNKINDLQKEAKFP